MPTDGAALLLVGGPSGTGKTCLTEALVASDTNRFRRLPSITTRARRPDEPPTYEHVSEAHFALLRERGELFNADRVHEAWYGVTKAAMEELSHTGLVGVKEIHPDNFAHFEAESAFPVYTVAIHGERFVVREGRLDSRKINPLTVDYLATRARLLIRAGCLSISEEVALVLAAFNASLDGQYPDPRTTDAMNQEAYSRLAPVFADDLRPTTANFHQATATALRRLLQQEAAGRLVEIGAGTGWLAKTFCNLMPGVEWIESDGSQGMVESRPGVVLAPPRALPFETNSANVMVGSLVDGLLYPEAMLEMRRVLVPGGRLIVSFPSHYWAREARGGDRFATFDIGHKVRAASFTPDYQELQRLAERTGFTATDFVPCAPGDPPYSPALFDERGRLIENIASVARMVVKE